MKIKIAILIALLVLIVALGGCTLHRASDGEQAPAAEKTILPGQAAQPQKTERTAAISDFVLRRAGDWNEGLQNFFGISSKPRSGTIITFNVSSIPKSAEIKSVKWLGVSAFDYGTVQVCMPNDLDRVCNSGGVLEIFGMPRSALDYRANNELFADLLAASKNHNYDIYLYDFATGTEVQITDNPGHQLNVAAQGNIIAWQDNRNGNWDIYVYDLRDGKEIQITKDSFDQQRPAVFGSRIAWHDRRNGNADIYMYDLNTGKETQITFDKAEQIVPAIFEDKIAWQDNRNGNWDIYLYDLAAGKETRITKNDSNQILPKIFGNNIAWEDYRNGSADVYLFDLKAGKEARISSDAFDQRNPKIFENIIAWQDNRNGNWEIYMYDLTSGEEKQITEDASDQENPSVFGNKVAWQDSRNGRADIFAFDYSSGQLELITSNIFDQWNPAAFGEKIAWQDWRSNAQKFGQTASYCNITGCPGGEKIRENCGVGLGEKNAVLLNSKATKALQESLQSGSFSIGLLMDVEGYYWIADAELAQKCRNCALFDSRLLVKYLN